MTNHKFTLDGQETLSPADTAKIMGVTTRTLARWRHDGLGPGFYTSPLGTTKYLKSELDRYIASRTTTPVEVPGDTDLNANQAVVLHHMNHTPVMSISGEGSDLKRDVSHNQTMAKLERHGLARAVDQAGRTWEITEHGLFHSGEQGLCARYRCDVYLTGLLACKRQEKIYEGEPSN